MGADRRAGGNPARHAASFLSALESGRAWARFARWAFASIQSNGHPQSAPHHLLGSDPRVYLEDRKSVVKGKRVSVRVDLGCRRFLKKNKMINVVYSLGYQSSKQQKK